jgi:ABC-2 type transport system permease protein
MSVAHVLAFARLELADALRSKWVAFTGALYGAVFVAFLWLGLRESSVLGFTGLSRVFLNVSNAVVLALPLIVLVASSQVVVRARQSGLFELLLSQPCRRGEWFSGMLVARATVLLAPLVLVVAATFAAGPFLGVDPELPAVAARCFVVAASLVWAFLGIGVLLSSVARTAERAIVYALLVFAFAAALHDFALMGLLLHTSLPPRVVFFLAILNPSEAARVGIFTSVDPELSVLGPVGFWLANTLGPAKALGVAIGWPLLLGTGALAIAGRRLRRCDLVA